MYKIVTEHAGYPKPTALLGGASKQLILDCMAANWSYTAEWTSNALNYLMENEGFDVVFSHFHNIDLQGHMIVKYLKDKGHNKMPEEEYQKCFEQVYIQTDNYIGKYLHLLDEGWTVLILSDHAAVCPEHEPPMIGDGSGCNVRLLQQLGFA